MKLDLKAACSLLVNTRHTWYQVAIMSCLMERSKKCADIAEELGVEADHVRKVIGRMRGREGTNTKLIAREEGRAGVYYLLRPEIKQKLLECVEL